MNNTNVRIGLFLIAGALVLFALLTHEKEEVVVEVEYPSQIKVGEAIYDVDLATTPQERQQGLSGRESLEENEGLLFIFEEPSVRNFWMKEMLFPIDIIWISEDLRIVHISKDLQPESYPETFNSKEPVLYVLEVNAQNAEKKGILIGDEVELLY